MGYFYVCHCHKILLEALEKLLFEEFCFSLGEERPMMGLPDDSFELLEILVDEPDNASFESLATLMALLFNKSVAPEWDISMFAKNTEKNVRYQA
jgi:hypothetical protein